MKPDGLAGRRVLVAMSGGVDSSVATALLAEQGAEVVGATYKNFCFTDADELPGRSCCSVDAVADALAVCRKLGIEHQVVDETARFQVEVVDDFEREYAAGRTPNPCVRCNAAVRFPRLVEEATSAGFDYVATGHYARMLREGEHHFMAAGLDDSKDQSYFLAAVNPSLHPRLLFPLGELTKTETRELARKAGLHTSEKRESQDVCFLGGGSLRDYLGERELLKPGAILDEEGEVLGEHPGAALFTLGQRHGLGVSASRPLYVTAVDTVANTVTLGDESDLGVTRLNCRGAWVHEALAIGGPVEGLAAKIRYRSPARPVADWSLEGEVLSVSFTRSVKAPAPGQSLVLYRDDKVMAHGILE